MPKGGNMKTTKSIAKLEAKFVIELTESEARALDNFAYFGAYEQTMEFIQKGWSNKINAQHLKGFFETVHQELNPHLSRVDKARKIFETESGGGN